MATMIIELTIEMDSGSPYEVVADQRDMAKWEVQPFGWPVSKAEENASVTYLRFLGYAAALRQGLTQYQKWDDFNVHCIEVVPMNDDDDSEEPNPLESPGQKTQSDTPTSS